MQTIWLHAVHLSVNGQFINISAKQICGSGSGLKPDSDMEICFTLCTHTSVIGEFIKI